MKLELEVYSFDVDDRVVVSIWIMVRNADGGVEAVHMPYADKSPFMIGPAIDVRDMALQIRRLLEFVGHKVEMEPVLLDSNGIEHRLLNCPHK